MKSLQVSRFLRIGILLFTLITFGLTDAVAQHNPNLIFNRSTNGKNMKQTNYQRLGELCDSLQLALGLTDIEVVPVTVQSPRVLRRFDQSALLSTLIEMYEKLEMDVFLPARFTPYNANLIFTAILEAAAESPPTLQTLAPSGIQSGLATLNGAVTDDGRKPLDYWGFKFGSDSTLSDSIHVPFGAYLGFLDTSAVDTGSFSFERTTLARYTTYYFAAWGENEKGIAFGDTLSFTTLPELASGIELGADSLTQNSAILTLTIADNGGQGPDSVGFFLGTTDFTDIALAQDSLPSHNSSGTDHTLQLTQLARYTEYFINAYVDNLAGRALAFSNYSFTTLPSVPVLDGLTLTTNPTAISCKAIDLGGDQSYPTPDSTGFYWGTEANLSNANLILGSFSSADSLFSSTLSDLEAGEKYYFSGFAANAVGMGNSDTLEVITPPAVTTIAGVRNLTDTSFSLTAEFDFKSIAPTATGIAWGFTADLSDATDQPATLLPDTTVDMMLVGQTPGTTLYYSAYASTSAGVRVNGDTMSFKVPIPLHDGNISQAVNAWIADSAAATDSYGHISNWYTGAVTNMTSLFGYKNSFNSDISGWDLSSVLSTKNMFYAAEQFNQDLSGWDMSNVTEASRMFHGAHAFTSDLSGWDVSNIISFEEMFRQAYAFESDLSAWTVNASNNFKGMFNAATIFNSELGTWDVSSATDLSYMFSGDTVFSGDVSSWDVSGVTSMEAMFMGAFQFQGDVSNWNVSSVQSMGYMFAYSSFDGDLSSWDVSNVTNMKSMFGTTPFNGDLSNWNVGNVQDMSNMFSLDTTFTGDLSNWNTSSVTNMSSMFNGCLHFSSDLSNWDVGSVTSMSDMFRATEAFQGDLNNWNVSAVKNMGGMFQFSSFDQALNNWDVGQVEDMRKMFALSDFSGDISAWNVGSVKNMAQMFANNHSFNSDISAWDVSSVTDLTNFLYNTTAFSNTRYSALLASWKNLSLQQDVQFTNTTHYTCNVGDKAYIESAFNWTIQDFGLPSDPCPATVPSVVTLPADSVGGNSFNLKGVIAYDGGASISGYGFILGEQPDLSDGADWSFLANPELDADGNLNQYLTFSSYGPGDTLFFTAFAENTQGRTYGDTVMVSTLTFPPIVETQEWTHIELGTTQLNGKINSDGGFDVSSFGFKWGTSPDLSNAQDTMLTQVASNGTFEATIDGLAAGSSVYYSAYATNALGTTFGDTVSFVPDGPFVCGVSTVNYNGYAYQTVASGSHCWFRENLQTDLLNDGTPIPEVTDGSDWVNQTSPARCSYNNDPNLGAQYGYLYNFYAVETEKLCPQFWGVPQSPSEYLSLNSEPLVAVKAAPSDSVNWDGTNATGWSAVPAGIRGPSSVGYAYDGAFNDLNQTAFFWLNFVNSSTGNPAGTKIYSEGSFAPSSLNSYHGQYKDYGLSVRCVKHMD
jgi:uncharacterized protein (TIGR02145 family)